jgi:hypothetical protein
MRLVLAIAADTAVAGIGAIAMVRGSPFGIAVLAAAAIAPLSISAALWLLLGPNAALRDPPVSSPTEGPNRP